MAGLAGVVGLPQGQVSTSIVSTENALDLGYESPPGIFDNVSQQGRGPAGSGHPDQREVAPDRGHSGRVSTSVPRRISGSPAARRTC